MQPARQILSLGLLSTCAAISCLGAVRPKSINAPTMPLTVEQAKAALLDSIHHTSGTFKPIQNLRIHHNKITYDWAQQNNIRWSLATVDDLAIRNSWGNTINVTAKGKETHFYWARADKLYATAFINALLTLKHALLTTPDPEAAEFVAFTLRAQTWLAAGAQSGMSDEARAYKMLAEDAFKRKEFTAALEAYGQALDKYPLWPEGHYNAALLAAETEDYELAAHHMRRYLVLAPDAPDAAIAKDKLILWQLKAKA